jgi:hypothetical protein
MSDLPMLIKLFIKIIIKNEIFECFVKLSDATMVEPLIRWSQNIYFLNQQGRITQKTKKKFTNKKFKFLLLFAKLWSSGKSAALVLGTQFFFICNLLKISFQNHYSLEFMHIKV